MTIAGQRDTNVGPMRNGKWLERLVRQVEDLLLPSECSVISNKRIYADDGTQLAEFDLEIKGRIGSTDLRWLIDCRDRPSDGPAPSS